MGVISTESIRGRGSFSQAILRVGIAAFAGILLSACAVKSSKSLVKECVLPDDQAGTLSGKWRTTAVPIAFHQGDFTTAEITSIMEAANTWNDFYAQSIGIRAIDYGTAARPRMSTVGRPTASVLCSEGIVSGNTYSGQVVLYKDSTWPYSSQPSVMALTTYCRSSGKPLPYFYIAIIDFNYQNFFVQGKRAPDLQSIILHEFGHLMGLNHSCESAARAGVPGCSEAGLNPEYLSASMFPTFTFDSSGVGQQKRDLQSNDQGRANCLYMNF